MRRWDWASIEGLDPGRWLATLNLRLKDLSGTINRGQRVVSVAAAYTVKWSDDLVLVDATAGAVTITLPPVASSLGQRVVIKKIDSSVNAVTVDGSGSEEIDGATTVTLDAQYLTADLTASNVTGTAAWWRTMY